MKCRFCDSETSVFLDLSHIPVSVTSDCRVVDIGIKLFICESCKLIQKDSTQIMQQNYFHEFCSHSISDGQEQVKFIDGVPIPRSEVIIKSIKKHIDKSGDLLDVGTGNGSFLKAFKKNFPSWQLHGQDIQSNSKEKILEIIPQNHLYIRDIKEIKNKFDMISIIGVLGHISNIKDFLKNLKNLTNENTKIVIQTPDLQQNFFDVVIIDHITYFNKSMLHKIMSKYFNNISFFDIVHKEITLGVNFSSTKMEFDYKQEKSDILSQAEKFKKFVDFLVNTKESYIVLGTAPVSTYIGAVLKDRLISFVDEDKVRVGKMHLNKRISHPNEIKTDSKIILPFLQKDIIEEIKRRFKSLNFISYEDM